MGKKKGKSKNAVAAKAKQAEPESVKGAKEDVVDVEGESHVAGTSTAQDVGPEIASDDKSEASDGGTGTPADQSGAVTPLPELDSAINTTEGVADDAIAKSADMQDNADETRDLPSVIANPGDPLQEILEEPVGEREQHATAQAVTEQTKQDDPKSPVKRPGSPSREDTSADTELAHDASIIASPPANCSAMAERPKASDAPLDKVKVDVFQGNERDTGVAANVANGHSTPDDPVGTPAVDRNTAGDDADISPVKADYLAPADQADAVDRASHMEGDISPSPTEPSPTSLGSTGAGGSPIRHSDESQRGAEIGTPRPAIFRKQSEEDVWGTRRMAAEGDTDTGVEQDGDIGLSNEMAEIELDNVEDVQVNQGANAAAGGSADVEEDHQAAQNGVLGNQRAVERDGQGPTVAEHEEEDDAATSPAVDTSGKLGDEQADGARPERRRNSATSIRSVALGRDAEEEGYREASTQDTDNQDSPRAPVSPGRAASPIPSKHDSLSRDYDTTANSDEPAFRNQGFRSVKPSASEKPHIPMSRPIEFDFSHDGDGGMSDMADMTEVQISHSPNQNRRSDASEAATDGIKSPSKRGWFSFGRKSSQTGSAKAASAAAASAEQESEIPNGYQRPPPEGHAAPPMSSRSISAHSVHSIHSVHSVHSGRSRVGSTGGSGQASSPGSRRPSAPDSPAPHSAGSELGTQASTPRRAAPPPRPFPAELLAQAEKEKEERDKACPSATPVSESAVDAGIDPASPPDPTSGSAAEAAAPTSVAAAVANIVAQPDAAAEAPAGSSASAATAPAKVDHGIGAKGISTFEKVLNYTRPQHLPPKTREEDDTHYHQWEEMMAVARQHQAEKRKAAEVRRLEKEKKLAAYTPKWEMLLQGGQPSIGQVREDEGLRRMWFEGVPGHLRNKAWSAAIGNPLAMSKDAYRSYVARANKAISSGRFPQDTLDAIERDMSNTLPQTKMFVAGSPMRMDLKELLTAWVVYRSDDGLGYAPYVSHIAAMLLIPSPPAQAFLNLVNLLSRSCLRAFVTETKDEIDAFYRVFENLQADTFPKIYANCSNLGLRLPQSYFRSVLVEQVPFEACCRLWDQIMLDGDGYIFRSALAIFGFLEPRLHYPDKEEILSVLEGRNKATHAITEREKERARLRGEAYDDELDGKLSVFGLNEDALFEWLARDEWKEARYERLVTREMPD